MRPQLRFPEFTDDWQVKKLGDIFEYKSTNSLSRAQLGDTGSVSNIHYGDIHKSLPTHLDSKKYTLPKILNNSDGAKGDSVEVGDIVIADASEDYDDIGKGIELVSKGLNEEIRSGLHTFLMSPKEDTAVGYYGVALKSANIRRQFRRIATGISVLGVSKNNVSKIDIAIPSKPEQEKIADFLTAVDERIRLGEQKLAKLEQYKRGVMQQIFSQKIRFKDESGNEYPVWGEKKLGELFTRITDKNKLSNKNVLTISSELGLVNQLDYYNHSYASKDLSGYTLIRKGDFAYNKSYSKGYPMGAVKRLSRYDSGVVSPLYICFRAKENVCSEFFDNYFEAGLFNSQIAKIAQEGARNHGLLNMSVVEFFEDTVLQIPSLNEQQKIATFLTALDNKITAEKSKLTASREFKKALLQKMFV